MNGMMASEKKQSKQEVELLLAATAWSLSFLAKVTDQDSVITCEYVISIFIKCYMFIVEK